MRQVSGCLYGVQAFGSSVVMTKARGEPALYPTSCPMGLNVYRPRRRLFCGSVIRLAVANPTPWTLKSTFLRSVMPWYGTHA